MNKPKFNEHYFDIIDTETKAYFLGLLFADGCVKHYTKGHGGWKTSIELQEQDSYILQNMAIEMGCPNRVRIAARQSYNGDGQTTCTLEFGSKHLYQTLCSLGMKEGKFNRQEKPPINTCLLPHFYRGYFDGDGAVWLYSNATSVIGVKIVGPKGILDSIRNDFINYHNLKEISVAPLYKESKSTKPLYKWQIGGRVLCHKFKQFMYQDATIFLKRKYKIFNQKEVMPS